MLVLFRLYNWDQILFNRLLSWWYLHESERVIYRKFMQKHGYLNSIFKGKNTGGSTFLSKRAMWANVHNRQHTSLGWKWQSSNMSTKNKWRFWNLIGSSKTLDRKADFGTADTSRAGYKWHLYLYENFSATTCKIDFILRSKAWVTALNLIKTSQWLSGLSPMDSRCRLGHTVLRLHVKRRSTKTRQSVLTSITTFTWSVFRCLVTIYR